MGAPVVEFSSVRRRFGPVEALAGLDLVVEPATITVLLGPNGAGKTTAVRMITGALGPDSGTVRVFGLDPGDPVGGEEVRRRCGVVAAKPALYDRLSGYDNLAYAAALYGVSHPRGAIAEAAGRFGIAQALDQQVGGYSTGMKTRLALARSVLHRPDLLLFDEPTSGLDPESSHAVLGLIREMTAEGSTIVMCTHLLLEAEGLADQVVVLEGGAALIAGTPEGLTEQFWPSPVVRIAAEEAAGLDRLQTAPGVKGYSRNGDASATVEVDDLARVPDLVFLLTGAGIRVTRVEPHLPTLEDLYFAARNRRVPAAESG